MSRWRYFIKRVLLAIPVLFLAMTAIFVIIRMGPLDPIAAILGPQGGPADAERIRAALGIDRPIWQQYIDFMVGLLTLDLGQSWVISRGRPVTEMIVSYGWRTLWLGFWSVAIAILIGIPLGFYAGLRPNSWGDYFASFGGILWRAMPNFWLAVMLLAVLRQMTPGGAYYFGIDWYEIGPNVDSLVGSPNLNFFGFGDWTSIGPIPIPTSANFDLGNLLSDTKKIMPPAIVLGSASLGSELRIGRTAILETINSNYVETAKAKGLSGRVIIWKHVFRNALIPLVPIITNEAFLLIGGSVIVETIFGINGLGYLFFQSAIQGDLPMAGSLMYIFVVLVILLNIFQDFLYTILDPRVGYER